MEKKTKLLVTVILVAVIATSLIAAGIINYVNQPSLTITGSLYFNDSGESHGGWEATMQWNVTLTVKAGFGLLVVTPEPGYLNNDRLQKWSYSISGFQVTDEYILMAIDGHPVVLEFVENDTVWNTYDNHYIGTPPDISPTIFPGFLSHYYVELRLSRFVTGIC
jgi:hypothetical protein